MPGKTHRLQIGTITCIVLYEGSEPTDLTADSLRFLYPNATDDEINQVLYHHGYGDQQPTFNMNALFIESAGNRILVDTGEGDTAAPNFGHIPAALQSEGIGVDDIDIVFISHFHGDHINGLLKNDGSPCYPNSRYVTTRAEWDYWMSEATLNPIGQEFIDRLRKTVGPLENNFSFLNAGEILVPGVTLVDITGHTPGHSGLLIDSDDEYLLAVMDLLHAPAQFTYPHWHFAYDTDGPLAVQSRLRVLARAADDNLLTLFYHLPFPGLVHVMRGEHGTFTFQPIEQHS